MCHPDKFENETKEIQKYAEAIFKELNDANENNNLRRVSEILSELEKWILSTSIGDKLTDKDKLRATKNRLPEKVLALEIDISKIKNSETFITISKNDSWDEYFKSTKEKLQSELEELLLELKLCF